MQIQSPETVRRTPEGRAAAIERILAVTGEEAARVGPGRIRMGEIAARAEVSRASLYRYFASKDELIRAWTTRELDAVFERSDRAAAEAGDDFEDRFAAGFAAALTALREHPVFRAIVALNHTHIMRSTLESGDALDHARELTLERLNRSVHAGDLEIGQFDAAVAGELLARIAVSLTATPESVGRLETEDDVREFARRHLTGLLRAGT